MGITTHKNTDGDLGRCLAQELMFYQESTVWIEGSGSGVNSELE